MPNFLISENLGYQDRKRQLNLSFIMLRNHYYDGKMAFAIFTKVIITMKENVQTLTYLSKLFI